MSDKLDTLNKKKHDLVQMLKQVLFVLTFILVIFNATVVQNKWV